MIKIRVSIIVSLVLGLYSSLSSSQVCYPKYDRISQILNGSNIIYDVTEIVSSLLQFQTEYPSNTLDRHNELTRYMYYSIDTSENRSICTGDMSYWLYNPQFQNIGVSFLVKCNKPFFETLKWSQSQQHLNYFVLHELCPPEAVIYRVIGNATAETCYDYCPSDEIMWDISFFQSEIKRENIQIGIEYNNRFMGCCSNQYPQIMKYLDKAIVYVELDFTMSLLSYSLFARQISKLSERNKQFCRRINANCIPYVHIKVPAQIKELSSTELNLYRAYVSEYTKTWSLKYNDVLTIDSFAVKSDLIPLGQQKYQKWHPFLHGFYVSYNNNGVLPKCKLMYLLETVSEVAQNVHLNLNLPRYMYIRIFDKCTDVNKPNSSKKHSYPFLHISLDLLSVNHVMNTIKSIKQHPDGIYRVKRIYVQKNPPLNNSSDSEIFWSFMKAENISVGCTSDMVTEFSLKTFVDEIIDPCDLVFQKSPSLLLTWPNIIKSNDISYLSKALKDVLYLRTEFRKRYFNGEIVLQPNVVDHTVQLYKSLIDSEGRVNIYCNEQLLIVHSFRDIIATWAQIYNFTLILGDVIDDTGSSMWYRLNIDPEVRSESTKFIVMVRRNIPETIEGSIKFPYTYPCLQYTLTPNCAIKFCANSSTGISFNANLKEASLYSSIELQTLLFYCFGRFSIVEMRKFHFELLGAFNSMFTSDFTDTLEPQLEKVGNLQLYFEVKEMLLLEQIIKTVKSQKSELHFGIHLEGWEHHNSKDNNKRFSALVTYMDKNDLPVKFGLSIENCLQEINSNLENLTALSYRKYIKYIVCNVKPVWPTNENQEIMQTFLDTNFYVKQYFKDRLNISVKFRLNFVASKCAGQQSDIANYLRFLNDVKQHAVAYGIEYFMGEAFSKEDDVFQYSWWKISDLGNLGDDSVYTELESKYFGRATTRALKVNASLSSFYQIIIGLAVLSLLLLGTTAGVGIYYRKMRNKFLTKEEIYNFRKGVHKMEGANNIELYDIKKHEAERHPFPDNFEISKDSIQLGYVIGQGNFGVVHKATLKTTETVAVKTPPPNCSKESFKTMLAEVKVLCYIGLHSNVLLFIGAYTQEIENGLIYIVTEYCEKGCLETYLRSKKVTTETMYESSSEEESLEGYIKNITVNQTIDTKDLFRFSFEIASGMGYLSTRRIFHGDLSARNVLLTGENVCKIGDFGLSRKLYDKEKYVKQGGEGLPWKWMAIESLKRMEFTTKSDVWSFGVTLWEIFTLGDVPYHGMGWTEEFNQRLENGMRLSKPPLASEETYTKMLQCWNISPDKRPQFSTLSSYFLKKLE